MVKNLIAIVAFLLFPGRALTQGDNEISPVTFAPFSAAFTGTQEVTLSTSTADAMIFYTTDGSPPNQDHGTRYKAALSLTRTAQLRAIAVTAVGVSAPSTASYLLVSKALAKRAARLPIMVIDTVGTGEIPGKGWSRMGTGVIQVPRKAAAWWLFETGLADAPQLSSPIGIRERGSFSSTWKQKPYSIETWDGAGEEAKVSP